jgi:putative DNA primase/helicase
VERVADDLLGEPQFRFRPEALQPAKPSMRGPLYRPIADCETFPLDALPGAPHLEMSPLPGDEVPTRNGRARRLASAPADFELSENGVFKITTMTDPDMKEPKVTRRHVCSYVNVLARSRNGDGEGWGYHVEVKDPDGGMHRWTIPASLFAGDATPILAGLLDLGLCLGRGKEAKNDVIAYLLQSEPTARALSVSVMGWTDQTCSAFVRGDGDVMGGEGVVYQSEIAAAAAEMRVQGTLEGWRRDVSALCTGNTLLVLAVSAAFVGPLLEPVVASSIGLHLQGHSSCGKTTALRVAASVWGTPDTVQSWRATSNGLEGVAAAFNSTLLILDELSEIAPHDAGQAAYMLGNGQGKKRANRDGRAKPLQRWRLAFLSSGEISLSDKAAEIGQRAKAGQAVRLIDLTADDRAHGAFDVLHDKADGAALSDALKAATAASYGAAGPAFVAALIALGREAVAAIVRTLADAFTAHATAAHGLAAADGQVKRVLERFALLAAAGELATLHGLTGWAEGEAQRAALDAFGRWYAARGGSKSAEAMEAVARVRAYLSTYGQARFEPIDGGAGRIISERAGWCDDDHYYVHPDAWAAMHKGANPKRTADHLIAAGFLEAGRERDRPTVRVPKILERPRAYKVKRTILAAKDSQTEAEAVADDGRAQ